MKHLVTADIQAMIRPLNLMQSILFCPKYNIRNNRISPNNFRTILLSVLASLACILALAYLIFDLFFDEDIALYSNKYSLALFVFEVTFYSVGFFLNTIATVTQTYDNIDFVLFIQEVAILLKLSSGKYTTLNWICVILVSVFCVAFTICCFVLLDYKYATYSWSFLLLLNFDVNITYAISSVNLLQRTMVSWNNFVINSDGTRDQHMCRRLFKAYKQILKCYNICNHTFGVLVSIGLVIVRRL